MPATSLAWTAVQHAADSLLAQGIFALRNRPYAPGRAAGTSAPGNYLISLDGRPLYVGEGIDLAARLRQQFNARTSTFYKNYLKSGDSDPRPITDFALQFMTTRFGRKEIEDFGIANIPAPLNRFQLDKRAVRSPASTSDEWDRLQAAVPDLLSEAVSHFWNLQPSRLMDAEVPSAPGVYALWQDSPRRVLYIGESSDLSERHQTHCKHTYFSALRRNIGTNLLGFSLHEVRGKRRYFTEDEERQLNAFLGGCLYQSMAVTLGRLELEEHLIARDVPPANRKVSARPEALAGQDKETT